MSDDFNKAPRAKVEAEEPQQHKDEQREASKVPGAQQDAASAGTSQEGAAQASAKSDQSTQNGVSRASAWVSRTFPGHENAFLGGVCGLVVAIVMAAIGFWRTLLLVLLVLIGVAIGQQADGDPKILRALGKIFRDHDTH
ncbi:DUF2273 domain-containing protein [Tractidigestivibacter montrealensis]|jgi:uncharacterized membrane protein|uniref:DUF2273 domain-containing protein n=1 Tax=Tractidigestivibacter montrealensis TaxID=2972466 RepID=A0ABT1ZAA2_9ACTN|nr:DUF2273 domain-containing protein [Tractidigestivibacter montrealensis]MCR9037129.1 DUF2273 domain-containing protein [Tractidigestivibacter montrealensis]